MDIIIQHPGMRSSWGHGAPGRLLGRLFIEGLWEWGELGSPLGWELRSGMSEVRSDQDSFAICLDVSPFHPEELTVRVQGDFLEIQGCHGDRQDAHGCVSREFCRRYQLPPDVDQTALTCSLGFDGMLTCSGPKVAAGKTQGPVLSSVSISGGQEEVPNPAVSS